MVASRKLSVLAGALLSISLVACSSDPVSTPAAAVAPPTAPNASLLGDVVGGVTGTLDGVVNTLNLSLLSCNVTQSYSAKQVFGPDGGVMRIGPHSFVVPPGALSSNVTISAYAPAGNRVQIDFQPDGLKFNSPTALTMSYQSCGLVNGLMLKVVYVDQKGNILESLLSVPNLLTRQVTGKVSHFSIYALAE